MRWLLAVLWFVSTVAGVYVFAFWLWLRVPRWVIYILYTLFLMVDAGWFARLLPDPKNPRTLSDLTLLGVTMGLLLGIYFVVKDVLKERSLAKDRRQRGW